MSSPATTGRSKHHRFPGGIIRHGDWLKAVTFAVAMTVKAAQALGLPIPASLCQDAALIEPL